MKKYTRKEIEFACEVFGIRVEDVVQLRDGIARRGSKVWWRCEDGPEQLSTERREDWDRVQADPQYYQINEPKVRLVYVDEEEVK